MASDNVFVSRILQDHGSPSDALVARSRELVDSEEFIGGVTKIRNEYASQYHRAAYWDGEGFTVSNKDINKLASNCEKMAALLVDTARIIISADLNDRAKVRTILGAVNDDAIGRIQSLFSSDFDTSLTQLSLDLRQSVAEYGLIKKGGEKALSVARRDYLIKPLARLFKQHGFSATNYSKDGNGKPSALAAFAKLIADDVGDTAATPASLGQIAVTP